MITVHVRTIGLLRSLLGGGDVEIDLPDGSRVGDLLRRLAETGGKELADQLAAADRRSVPPALRLLVNGRDIGVLQDRATALSDGDDVLILTPLAGG